jgi:ribosomal protein S18 acetylase RimI-like enzyme
MAAIDSASQKTEVMPFGRLAPGALDGVLAAQGREWLERLDWDIAEITAFVAGAIRSRSLRGTAVLVGGEPAGFGFYTVEVDRCLIGELYVTPEHRGPELHAALVDGLARQIRNTKPRKRVESQSIVFDARGFDEAFAALGFERHGREYLAAELATGPPEPAGDHPRVEVRAWKDSDFAAAVDVVYEAYRGSVDARTNVQYRTREGCADLLDALTDSPWCGRFEPALARVAVDRATGRCCGVAVASAISERAAHFGQISVLPAYQNEGVGRAMIRGALASAASAGYPRATLAVTSENAAAAGLYRDLGFRTLLEFPVYTRDPAPLRARTR